MKENKLTQLDVKIIEILVNFDKNFTENDTKLQFFKQWNYFFWKKINRLEIVKILIFGFPGQYFFSFSVKQ